VARVSPKTCSRGRLDAGQYDIEVSTGIGNQAIFIRWAWDSGGDFHELLAGRRAPIHVVADDRYSRGGRGVPPTLV
jgi:hypothetical protein